MLAFFPDLVQGCPFLATETDVLARLVADDTSIEWFAGGAGWGVGTAGDADEGGGVSHGSGRLRERREEVRGDEEP